MGHSVEDILDRAAGDGAFLKAQTRSETLVPLSLAPLMREPLGSAGRNGERMKLRKCGVLFDCLNTLLLLDRIPTRKEEALWGYKGIEKVSPWGNADLFLTDFFAARKMLRQRYGAFRENTFYETMIEATSSVKVDESEKHELAALVEDSLLQHYIGACRITATTIAVLKELSEKLRLIVVSNFPIRGGIQHLLKAFALDEYFYTVLNSADTGWRKPHRRAYELGLTCTALKLGEVAFVGDSLENDYQAPRSIGMDAILFDPNEQHTDVSIRIRCLDELPDILSYPLHLTAGDVVSIMFPGL